MKVMLDSDMKMTLEEEAELRGTYYEHKHKPKQEGKYEAKDPIPSVPATHVLASQAVRTTPVSAKATI